MDPKRRTLTKYSPVGHVAISTTADISMKGTIYLWILAAVLSGALVGLLGFSVEGVFSVQSSFMEPLIIGAIAGVVAVLITIALLQNGKGISCQNSASN